MIDQIVKVFEAMEKKGVPAWALCLLALQAGTVAYGESAYIKQATFEQLADLVVSTAADAKADRLTELYFKWCGSIPKGDEETTLHWWDQYAAEQKAYRKITGNGEYPLPRCKNA